MDGIFGIGLAEMLIIALVLFLIGGPANTAKWARDLGRFVGKARQMWVETLAGLEREIGPEGKEIMDAARELGQGARDAARMNPTRQLIGETMRMVEEAADTREERSPAAARPPAPGAAASPSPVAEAERPAPADDAPRYPAWLPPDGVPPQAP
jgi:Sec-independent protein translocase protein TatA